MTYTLVHVNLHDEFMNNFGEVVGMVKKYLFILSARLLNFGESLL